MDRVRSGELVEDCVKNKHLTVEQAARQEQVYCTHSQILEYLLDEIRLAVAHRYVPPAGFGGPSIPDPKYLEINGETYAVWVRNTLLKKIFYWGLGWAAGIRYKLFDC